MGKCKKFIWQQVDNTFNLQVKNPEVIDKVHLKNLLRKVEYSSANWRKNMRFRHEASVAFEKWFDDFSSPLPAYAYALLSNWFTTSLSWVKESPRGIAALELWNTIFCAIPESRLTNPKRNTVIKKECFKLWWPRQQECQKNC